MAPSTEVETVPESPKSTLSAAPEPSLPLASDTLASPLPDVDAERVEPTLRASRVPSSRLGRLFHYGSRSLSLRAFNDGRQD